MSYVAAQEWEALMDLIVETAEERGDYSPEMAPTPPGSGSEGDDPRGLKYANLGPLAFVLNEAVDSAVTRGADRDALLEQVSQAAGEGTSVDDLEAILAGDAKCPPLEVLAAFADGVSIDGSIVVDAAVKGGCTNYSPGGSPPGAPGY